MIKACIYACSMEKPEKSIKYKNEFNPVRFRSAAFVKRERNVEFTAFLLFFCFKKFEQLMKKPPVFEKNASFDMEKYLSGLTIADFELSDASSEDYTGNYDPQGTTLGQDLVRQVENADGVEDTGHAYSHQFVWQMDDPTAAGLDLQYVIPSGTFRELYPDNTLRKLYVNVEDGQVDAMQEMLDTYTASVDRTLPVTSRQSMAQQYQEETRSSAVMGNAISMIIALVGVLNFANSMITAIVSRRREFAMIQSVGMTKRQLCRMLVYEGLYYARLTLLVSWTVSALAVGVGVRAVTAADDFATFHFTLLPLGICTPLILVLAVVIPYLCFRNLEKHSVVERLRME